MATIVAYNKACEKVSNIEKKLNIMYIEPDAKTNLLVKDIILEVGDIKNPTLKDISSYLETKKVGDKISIKVLRNKKEVETSSTLIEKNGKTLVGIVFIETFDYELEKTLTFDDKNGESGPSGGLMMTLSIYNNLVKEDLTSGKKIVGTGTIDINGTVGEIDGVKYKILGSKDADIFFCPKNNYKEAKEVIAKNDLKMKLVSIDTFDDAVNYLENN